MTSGHQLRAADRRCAAVAIAVGLLLAACSSGTGTSPSQSSAQGQYPGWPGSGTVVANSDFIPLLVNSELAVGSQRVMVELQDSAGRSLTSGDLDVQIAFFDLVASTTTAVSQAAGTFRWLIPDTKAIYTAAATFTHAGDWGLEVTARAAGQADRTARVTFSVRDSTTTPAIGAGAPASDTLTASDPAALPAISTDEHPDPAFYTLSVKDAIAAGKPFVLVFATPLFCTSGTCGPALDLVKQVSPDYAGRVNFIHVEPYVLEVKEGRTQPVVDLTGYPKPIRAVAEWGLPSEPYVFVVDAHGKVAAKFEGLAYPDELTAVLDALLP
jgi:hypothetical protein